MSQERLEEVKERIAEDGIFIPLNAFRGLTSKELSRVIPRKCSVCKSLKHTKQNCPLELGYGYLELFRGVMLNDSSLGDENLREKYGWGDGDGYIEKGYRQSFTTNPMVAALFALSPKNSMIQNVNNLEEYAQSAGIRRGFGITIPAEAWLRQNVAKAYRAYLSDPYVRMTDMQGNALGGQRKVPIVFRAIVKATKENMENIDITEFDYQGRFALEQEYQTDDALKLTHIGIPYHCYDFGEWIVWAKYEDIPPEVFESATKLYDWMLEEAYFEDAENDIYDDLPVNAKSSRDEFGAMWWPLKVPVLIQEQLAMGDESLEEVANARDAWTYYFKVLPEWESYRLSRFNQLKRNMKERESLEKGRTTYFRINDLSTNKPMWAYAIARFNYAIVLEKMPVERLENPYFEDYKNWLRQNKGMRRWITDEFIDELTIDDMLANFPMFPNPRWS